ncbi:hypothetical protein RHGRI_013843 [Rhododendron griersonianum]|uniref:16S rRNA (uracil(1498)-N(3))-methyltransferase n=1 Tax=Rhododendron griersonianum TaxID=479676 RepID=A0AAV6K711_9ERIC|nr:hypothetical protein RHGRI_013843 [Rhododendron griersonianum]
MSYQFSLIAVRVRLGKVFSGVPLPDAQRQSTSSFLRDTLHHVVKVPPCHEGKRWESNGSSLRYSQASPKFLVYRLLDYKPFLDRVCGVVDGSAEPFRFLHVRTIVGRDLGFLIYKASSVFLDLYSDLLPTGGMHEWYLKKDLAVWLEGVYFWSFLHCSFEGVLRCWFVKHVTIGNTNVLMVWLCLLVTSNVFAASLGSARVYCVSAASEYVNCVQEQNKVVSMGILEKAKGICTTHGVNAETIAQLGDPKQAICDAVIKHNIDLVVLGLFVNSEGTAYIAVFLGTCSVVNHAHVMALAVISDAYNSHKYEKHIRYESRSVQAESRTGTSIMAESRRRMSSRGVIGDLARSMEFLLSNMKFVLAKMLCEICNDKQLQLKHALEVVKIEMRLVKGSMISNLAYSLWQRRRRRMSCNSSWRRKLKEEEEEEGKEAEVEVDGMEELLEEELCHQSSTSPRQCFRFMGSPFIALVKICWVSVPMGGVPLTGFSSPTGILASCNDKNGIKMIWNYFKVITSQREDFFQRAKPYKGHPTILRKSHIPDGPGYQEIHFNPGDTLALRSLIELLHSVCQQFAGISGFQRQFELWFSKIQKPQDTGLDSRDHWKRVMQGHAGAIWCLLCFCNDAMMPRAVVEAAALGVNGQCLRRYVTRSNRLCSYVLRPDLCFSDKCLRSVITFEAERGYRNALCNNMRFKNFLFHRVSKLCSQSKHKIAEKLLVEADRSTKESFSDFAYVQSLTMAFYVHLIVIKESQVSVLMVYNGLQDLIESERAQKESVMNLKYGMGNFDVSLACKQFPSILFGCSPPIELYEDGLLSSEICKEFLSSSVGTKWVNPDSPSESWTSLYPCLPDVHPSFLREESANYLPLSSERLNLEAGSDTDVQLTVEESSTRAGLEIDEKAEESSTTAGLEIDEQAASGGIVRIQGDEFWHMTKVLRLSTKDSTGDNVIAPIRKGPVVHLVGNVKGEERVELFNGKGGIIEGCIQSIDRTGLEIEELGASSVTPLLTERSPSISENRVDRLERVILAAAKQCQRLHEMTLNPPTKIGGLLPIAKPSFVAVAEATPVFTALSSSRKESSGSIIIGPEGG